MARTAIIGAAAAGVLLAGYVGAAEAAAALDCPERQGDLQLSGRSEGLCNYAGADGTVVALRRLAAGGGSVETTLATLKSELKALLPAQPANAAAPAGGKAAVNVDNGGERIAVRASGDGAAEVDVRGDRDGQVRATFILASDQAGPAGWQLAGYEARGPEAGPLTVATVKSRAKGRDQVFDDMRALVRRNAG
jgi:hypothetical protein